MTVPPGYAIRRVEGRFEVMDPDGYFMEEFETYDAAAKYIDWLSMKYQPTEDFYNLSDLRRRLDDLDIRVDDGTADDEESVEFEALRQLAVEVSDWQRERPLIADHHFTEFAKQSTEEVYDIDRSVWPFNHVDWDAAIKALKADYQEVKFGGSTYFVRK